MDKVERCPWGTGMRKDLVACFQEVFPCPLGLRVGMVPRFSRAVFLSLLSCSEWDLMMSDCGLGAEPA